MSTPGIDRMTWEEKLCALEELWDAIAHEGDRYESPAWHEQELNGPQQHCSLGAEDSMDWASAKRELRR